MSEHDSPARAIRAAMEAHGLTPSDEEIATFCLLAPVLRAMTDQLYAVRIGAEL